MWSEQDEEYFLKTSKQELIWAREQEDRKHHPDAVALMARESGAHGIQALLMQLKVAEVEEELAELSEKYYRMARNKGGSVGAMWGDMSIAYGIQALLAYFERKEIERKKSEQG